MLRLLTHPYDLPLAHPFTISRSTVTVQPTLIVELTDGKHRGFGEATTNSSKQFFATCSKLSP